VRVRAVAGFVGAGCILSVGFAFAAPDVPFELIWRAPPDCAREAAVRADVERLSGLHLAPYAPGGVRVEATASRRKDGTWTIDLTIVRAGGAPRRRPLLEGASCQEVSEAAASVLALALVGSEPSEETFDRTPPPTPAPQPVRKARPSPARETPALKWDVGVVAAVDATALPKAAPGFGVTTSLEYSGNRVELRGLAFIPQRAVLTERSGADVELYTGALRYCRSLVGRTVELFVCGGLEAGAMRATGFGFKVNRLGLGPWLAPELGLLALARPTERLALSLEGDGSVMALRRPFVVDETVVYTMRQFDARVLLGVRLELH
jgi:hypothetical protein